MPTALVPVVEGRVPLLVHVERGSDILNVLELRREFPALKLVLVGATEGWTVAREIAAAGVPVIASALNDLPDSFETLAATQSNIGRMKAAGVKVSIGMINDDEARRRGTSTQYAGNLVALAEAAGRIRARLGPGASPRSPRRRPRRSGMGGEIGSLRAGRRADVVIWDGDPLELASAPTRVWIDGVEQPLENRQTRLRDRYRTADRRRACPRPTSGERHGFPDRARLTAAFVGKPFLLLSHPLRARPRQKARRAAISGVLFGRRARDLRLDDLRGAQRSEQAPLWNRAPMGRGRSAAVVMLLASILLRRIADRQSRLARGQAAGAARAPRRRVRDHAPSDDVELRALGPGPHRGLADTRQYRDRRLRSSCPRAGRLDRPGRKKAKLMGDAWNAWVSRTAFVPFTGSAPFSAWWPGWVPFLGGLALWLLATWAHPMFGAPG